MSQDIKSFVNPQGYWFHDGAYSVELAETADKNTAPDSVQFEGNKAIVSDGRIKQSMGGIQFHSKGQPFHWRYRDINVIRDGEGNPLWVNWDYQKNL